MKAGRSKFSRRGRTSNGTNTGGNYGGQGQVGGQVGEGG